MKKLAIKLLSNVFVLIEVNLDSFSKSNLSIFYELMNAWLLILAVYLGIVKNWIPELSEAKSQIVFISEFLGNTTVITIKRSKE